MGLLKEEVGYKISNKKKVRCLTCDNFFGPASCELVEGNISPEAVCERWYITGSKISARGGEYYNKEYRRNKGG